MFRRAVAIYMSLCLLAMALFTASPAKAALVCRMTGRPMVTAATEAAPAKQRPCCAAKRHIAADDGGTQAALTHPGCCELRRSPGQSHPAATFSGPESFAVALATAVPSVDIPTTVVPATDCPARQEMAPRAPPGADASPRAPPTLL